MADASPFPRIADYAFLSDCHTGALVAPDGSIEWLCLPWFDSPSAFSTLLDRGAGAFRVGPYGVAVPAGRRYDPGTNVLETTWMTRGGWLVVRDALTIGEWRDDGESQTHVRPPQDYDADRILVRTIECTYGEVPVEFVCEPQFEYGQVAASWEASPLPTGHQSFVTTSGGEPALRLTSSLRGGIEGDRVRGRHVMREGERAFVALSWRGDDEVPHDLDDAFARVDRTSHYWRRWLETGAFPDHPWRVYLQRSALVLKGLTFMPTGALVAAPTTSLPETPQGERNWDYRYCWMRDAAFTLWGLHALGMDWEAEDFLQFVADLDRNEDGSLQIMYGIRGARDLTESTLDHLKGYEGAVPVRIGNGAYDQRQNDVYGAVLDSVYIHTKETDHIPERLWPVLVDQVEAAARVWCEPDQGIWEARGEPQHYVSSKVMCWVAMDRGAQLATMRGETELAQKWQAVADEIQAEVLEQGMREDGVFRQHYGTDALDASTLLIPLQRFLPGDDPRVRATAEAIADELTQNGLVLRYKVDETDDGLHGREGTFLICSFWLVSVLSEIGDKARAKALCERLLSYAGSLLLYAEELDAASGRHLGNYPQAFTHLALINAVSHVIADES